MSLAERVAVAAGKLALVPRTTGISTSELIRRVLEAFPSGDDS